MEQLKRTWDDKPMGPHPCKTCIHWNDNRCTGNVPWGHGNLCDNCTYHDKGIYTQQQRDVMLYRLMRKLKHNQVIQLNKKDPLPVKFVKTSWDLKFIDVATKTEIVHVSRVAKRLNDVEFYMEFIKEVERAIIHWDLVMKQHFIDVARMEGLDP